MTREQQGCNDYDLCIWFMRDCIEHDTRVNGNEASLPPAQGMIYG
jgi:hypothetical protein